MILAEMEQAARGIVQPIGEYLLNGLVQKQVITPGAGKTVPDDAEVRLTLTMYVARDFKDINPDGMHWLYEHTSTNPLVKLLSDIMPIGLQHAVSTMCSGEKALVWINPLMAYGSIGLCFGNEPTQSVPPNATLFFEVHLLSWKVNDLKLSGKKAGGLRFEDLPQIDEMLIRAEKDLNERKERSALRQLCQAIRQLEHTRISHDKQEKKRRAILLEASILASESALAIGKYPLAVTFGRRVLEIVPLNASANYIVGRAYFALGYNSSAKHFVQKAWCCDVQNKKYKKTLEEIRKHTELVCDDTDVDDVDDADIHEQLAEVIMEKRSDPKVERALIKTMSKFINSKKAGRITVINGGFTAEFIEGVEALLRKSNVYLIVVRTSPTSLEIQRLD